MLCLAQDLAVEADRYVDLWFKAGKFMSSVLVARNGETLFQKSYGWANSCFSRLTWEFQICFLAAE